MLNLRPDLASLAARWRLAPVKLAYVAQRALRLAESETATVSWRANVCAVIFSGKSDASSSLAFGWLGRGESRKLCSRSEDSDSKDLRLKSHSIKSFSNLSSGSFAGFGLEAALLWAGETLWQADSAAASSSAIWVNST